MAVRRWLTVGLLASLGLVGTAQTAVAHAANTPQDRVARCPEVTQQVRHALHQRFLDHDLDAFAGFHCVGSVCMALHLQ